MQISWRRLLLGSPLPSEAYAHQRLNKAKGPGGVLLRRAVVSGLCDGRDSAGAGDRWCGGAYAVDCPLPCVITGLLAIVATSYYQTVHGYPSGGGAYIVAHENLGVWPGLIAAAALLIDYVLTVAVSITAGVVAVTSAVPGLFPYRIELCLLAIALITWGNLRGVRESGTLFSIPTYAFIGLFLTLIAVGFVRLLTGSLSPVAQPRAAAGRRRAPLP